MGIGKDRRSRTLSTSSGTLDRLNVWPRAAASRTPPIFGGSWCWKATFRSHRADRPVCRIGRLCTHRPRDHGSNLIVVASSRPARRACSNRSSQRSFKTQRNHLPMVCSSRPSSAATDSLSKPSAHRKIARHRSGRERQHDDDDLASSSTSAPGDSAPTARLADLSYLHLPQALHRRSQRSSMCGDFGFQMTRTASRPSQRALTKIARMNATASQSELE